MGGEGASANASATKHSPEDGAAKAICHEGDDLPSGEAPNYIAKYFIATKAK